MSIYVADFNGTSWVCVHDDAPGGAHSGTIDPTSIVHTTDSITGAENHNFLVIQCPVCDSVSTHPVGGGAQPESVQQTFVNKCQSDGCPCGQVQATDADALGESHVRLQVNRMDGPGRWTLG